MSSPALADAFARSGADTLDAAVIATTPEGLVTFWSRGARRLYGWESPEAVGRNIVDLTPAEASRATAGEIMDALGKGRAWQGRFPVRRRDGSQFEAYVVDTPVAVAGGRLSAVVGVSGPAEAHAQVASANMLLWHTLRQQGEIFAVPEAPPSEAYAAAAERSPARAYYRTYLIGPGGGFTAVREGFFASDDEALGYARAAAARELDCHGAEVWQTSRQVGRVGRD